MCQTFDGYKPCIDEEKQLEVLDAVEFARRRLKFEPDEKQAEVLSLMRSGILNCTRQWGKSILIKPSCATRALHRKHPGLVDRAHADRRERSGRSEHPFARRLTAVESIIYLLKTTKDKK
jgi:hypothetical protein